MTPEQRLDRLERIVKLMVKAGLRARGHIREEGERMNMIIDFQMKNEHRFAKLAEAQAHTDQRLDALIEIVREGRNGRSSNNN
jgi:hypothetical protein